jgi:nucleotide-binding universal stress UspA family protein
MEALALACVVARQRKAKVFAVNVIEVLRSLPLDAQLDTDARRGEQVLRKAEEVASAQGYQVSGELLQAREAGQAIVDEARERDIDVIVLGVRRRPLVGHFDMGRTAEFVLRNAPCEVWVVRQGAKGGLGFTASGHEQEHS